MTDPIVAPAILEGLPIDVLNETHVRLDGMLIALQIVGGGAGLLQTDPATAALTGWAERVVTPFAAEVMRRAQVELDNGALDA